MRKPIEWIWKYSWIWALNSNNVSNIKNQNAANIVCVCIYFRHVIVNCRYTITNKTTLELLHSLHRWCAIRFDVCVFNSTSCCCLWLGYRRSRLCDRHIIHTQTKAQVIIFRGNFMWWNTKHLYNKWSSDFSSFASEQISKFVYFVAVTHFLRFFSSCYCRLGWSCFDSSFCSLCVNQNRLTRFRKRAKLCSIRKEWFINNSFGDCFLSLSFIEGNHVPRYASFVDLIGPNRSVIIKPLCTQTLALFYLFNRWWVIFSCFFLCPSACNVTPQLVTHIHIHTWAGFCRSNNDLTHFSYWIKSRFDLNACTQTNRFSTTINCNAIRRDNECHCNRSLNIKS